MPGTFNVPGRKPPSCPPPRNGRLEKPPFRRAGYFGVPPDKLVSGRRRGGTDLALVLWEFWTYSFLGYLLEKGFAAVRG